MKPISRVILSALLLCGVLTATLPEAALAAEALPATSIYQLPVKLSNQDGKAFRLAELRGKPVLVSMFYNSCEFVCPMLIDTMRLTQQALDQPARDQLSMLLVTFDPARDDVKALHTIAHQRELDKQWTLARSDAAGVRKLAASLDIQYRKLQDGQFNHTTVLVLLDGEGRVVGSTRKMGTVDPEFLQLLKNTLAAR